MRLLLVGLLLAISTIRPATACPDLGRPSSFWSCEETSGAERPLLLQKEAIQKAIFDNCFLAGTLVAMADGSRKPIEEVRAGDRVKAGDPARGEVVDREVVRTFRNVTDTVVDVTWAPLDRVECMPIGQRGRGERHSVGSSRDGGEGGEDGEPPSAQTVRCTPGHPWWVESQQRWVFAGDLRAGDLLKLDDGRLGVVVALEVHGEIAQTFNFEVESLHTYFVGRGEPGSRGAGALVHNKSKYKYKNVPRPKKDGGKSRGRWEDESEPGNSRWIPANKKLRDRTGGGVDYVEGKPDFSPFVHDASWKGKSHKAQLTFSGSKKLKGNRDESATGDFGMADQEMADALGMKSKAEFKRYRRARKLTWHHHEDGITMQLVPRQIHSLPHSGGVHKLTS